MINNDSKHKIIAEKTFHYSVFLLTNKQYFWFIFFTFPDCRKSYLLSSVKILLQGKQPIFFKNVYAIAIYII